MKFINGHHPGNSYCTILGITVEVDLFWRQNIKIGTYTEYYCDPDSSYPDDVYCNLVERSLPKGIDEASAQALAKDLFFEYLENVRIEALT